MLPRIARTMCFAFFALLGASSCRKEEPASLEGRWDLTGASLQYYDAADKRIYVQKRTPSPSPTPTVISASSIINYRTADTRYAPLVFAQQGRQLTFYFQEGAGIPLEERTVLRLSEKSLTLKWRHRSAANGSYIIEEDNYTRKTGY
ncbi:hypothetical protein KBK19_06520 [Microvirga sp. STR05]|uniref:Lipocalin-like domain-containing protein n=1 Tax=Hymenobacter duratus TaxID=2771356 RepID=A0ABR8JCY5_9BACT|nr:hypothetical protein [Hymenobacter duratus]MBD2714681.1 hypothetical protein [Hymenobacter duratus]MBR7949585.1 hypothetical protein [Microvirga sp. STR05]